MRNRYAIITTVMAIVVAFDQLTKAWVLTAIPQYTKIPVIKGLFNLVHVRNRGAAFGFLNRHDIFWQFWLFLGASLIAGGVVFLLAKHTKSREYSFFTALGLILGGAIGNLIDRIRFREVVDILDFYCGSYHWPAFNVADIAICCGAALALILSWRSAHEGKKEL